MRSLWLLPGLAAGAPPDSLPSLRTDPVYVVAADLRRTVPRVLARDHIPGMAIALIREGRVAWVGGFGVRSSIARGAVDGETVFPAASLGKPATAHAALRLVDRGALELDRPLGRSLEEPWLGDDAPITLRQVLAHTSGLSNFLGDQAPQPRFPPGERFEYSGVGFMYLQHVLELHTGSSLDSVVAGETFAPLGITRAWFGSLPEGTENVASGHVPLGRAVAPFGIVFLPLWVLALVIGSVAARLAHGRWRPGRVAHAIGLTAAAIGTTAFLYSKAANTRVVPFFVLAFVVFALACLAVAGLPGLGRRRWVRVLLVPATAVVLFALARLTPIPVPHATAPAGNAASSLRATAGGLARLVIELGRPALLDSTTASELRREQAKISEHIAWGLGIGLQRAARADAVFHWGRNPAARAAMVYYPDAGTGVVVLANSGTAGDAVAEIALRAIGGPSYWAEE